MNTWIEKMKTEGLYSPPQFAELLREWEDLEYIDFSEDEEENMSLLERHSAFTWKLLDLLGRCYVACGIPISHPTNWGEFTGNFLDEKRIRANIKDSRCQYQDKPMPEESKGVI